MLYFVRKLYHPEFYQGPRRLKRYFEGWYYKTVTSDGAFAVIPGVSRARDDPHAFVQYLDGETGRSAYHRFPLDAFAFRRDRFEIAVGKNRFSSQRFQVDLPEIECDLEIVRPAGWPSSLSSPGTMGWYSFVPFMQCRHGIIVMDAVARGTVNGTAVDDGRLYVEKDYGVSFPNAWVWTQCNTFNQPGVSVSCSIANVPFVGGAFTGMLAGILVDGDLHRFTTYTGARLALLEVDHRGVRIVVEDRRERLEIMTERTSGTDLPAPELGAMTGRVAETLRSRIDVTLSVDHHTVFSGSGARAGLELVAHERLITTGQVLPRSDV